MEWSEEVWGKSSTGDEILKWTISNESGMVVEITNMGAALVSVSVPDREGHSENVNLGYDSAADYETNGSSFGVIVGRFANRIGAGRFVLDETEYQLDTNGGRHHIHGGRTGFARRLWRHQPPRRFEAEMGEPAGTALDLLYTAEDGEEGYPGKLDVMVTYILHTTHQLTISYHAWTDRATIVNLTNHAYWNLRGPTGGVVHEHELQLFASHYLENDETTLPTGRILPVAGTPFDFLAPRPIGSHIEQVSSGYDNCYVIDGWDGKLLRPAAKVRDPRSGRTMAVETTEPGVQLYTANHFDRSARSAGFGRHEAFCLECQHFPDSPNQPAFPSTVLRPGETYRQTTIHRFGVE